MTFVKFCGITTLDDAETAVELGVDALGFNFYARSPRAVSAADAQSIARTLPPDIWRVGVFADHVRPEIEHIARLVALDTLQFHGDESVKFCSDWPEWRVIKALRFSGKQDVVRIGEYLDAVDFVLLDRYEEGMIGGSGKQIGDELLDLIPQDLWPRIILAGGLTRDNVASHVQRYQPYGVDVASGIEVAPGYKSIEKMHDFLQQVRG